MAETGTGRSDDGVKARRWPRIKELFHAAIELRTEERHAFLSERCADDPSLVAEVESLVTADDGGECPERPVERRIGDAVAAPFLSAGVRLGPYQLHGLLKTGGMGDVYRAFDTRLDRVVAVKILPPHLRGSPELRARFEREAHSIAQLNHPHICAIYDVGRENGVDFLVMEFLEGQTVEERILSAGQRAAPPFSIQDALGCAIDIAGALDHAHRQGIVHRDLKPANIVLTTAGAKLLDFGIAKLIDRRDSRADRAAPPPVTPMTEEGVIVGTLNYMAPEQLEGRSPDARCDVFAFGAVLFEMLTGNRAFDGESVPGVIAAILKGDTPSLATMRPAVPAALEHVVAKCLAKSPDDRWQAIRDVRDELRWIAETEYRVLPTRSGGGDRASRRWVAPVAAALLIGAAIGVAAYVAGPRRDQRGPVSFVIAAPDEGPLSTPTVSPDGKMIVFASGAGGTNQLLWIRALDSPSASPVPGSQGAAAPCWAPDSRAIAFWQDGQIKRIPIAGGRAVTVASAPVAAGETWSAGGDILFSNGDTLFVAPAAGGSPRQVTRPQHSRGEAQRWPFFLPDSDHFLYTSTAHDASSSGIYLGALSSPESRLVIPGASNAIYVSPGLVLYLDRGVLKTQRFDLSRGTVGEPSEVARNISMIPDAGMGEFSASPAGVLAYNEVGVTATELAWVDRVGHQVEALPADEAYWDPALSPDGSQIAYTRADPVPPFQRDIWTFDRRRRVASRLTSDSANDWYPIWSADGHSLLFASQRSGANDFYVKRVDSVMPEQLILKADSIQWPNDWSSDGRFLIYQTRATQAKYDLWVMPFDEPRRSIPFVQSPFDEQQAQFSPDGRFVAYTSDETGVPEVYVQPFPAGGAKWRVSRDGGCQPRWRRDGGELYYLSANRYIMAAAVRLSPALTIDVPYPLFPTHVPEGGVGTGAAPDYAVSRDGERFLLKLPGRSTRGSANLTVIVGWSALNNR